MVVNQLLMQLYPRTPAGEHSSHEVDKVFSLLTKASQDRDIAHAIRFKDEMKYIQKRFHERYWLININ